MAQPFPQLMMLPCSIVLHMNEKQEKTRWQNTRVKIYQLSKHQNGIIRQPLTLVKRTDWQIVNVIRCLTWKINSNTQTDRTHVTHMGDHFHGVMAPVEAKHSIGQIEPSIRISQFDIKPNGWCETSTTMVEWENTSKRGSQNYMLTIELPGAAIISIIINQ